MPLGNKIYVHKLKAKLVKLINYNKIFNKYMYKYAINISINTGIIHLNK